MSCVKVALIGVKVCRECALAPPAMGNPKGRASRSRPPTRGDGVELPEMSCATIVSDGGASGCWTVSKLHRGGYLTLFMITTSIQAIGKGNAALAQLLGTETREKTERNFHLFKELGTLRIHLLHRLNQENPWHSKAGGASFRTLLKALWFDKGAGSSILPYVC